MSITLMYLRSQNTSCITMIYCCKIMTQISYKDTFYTRFFVIGVKDNIVQLNECFNNVDTFVCSLWSRKSIVCLWNYQKHKIKHNFLYVCGSFFAPSFYHFGVGLPAYLSNHNPLSKKHIFVGFNEFPALVCCCIVI